jgi:hypothetical protein
VSTVRFIEHNGERIEIPADGALLRENRCDLCGEFVDDADLLRVDLGVSRRGAFIGRPIVLDVHPGCLRKLGEQIAGRLEQAGVLQ